MKRALYWLDVMVYFVFAYWVARLTPWGTRFAVGMAIAAIGFTLWMTARLQLGRSFTVSAQARALVTRGLYKRFRHPVYTFSIVCYAGLVIAAGWWWGLLGAPGIWLMQSFRMRKEDAVLEKAFGEEYRAYRAGTWM